MPFNLFILAGAMIFASLSLLVLPDFLLLTDKALWLCLLVLIPLLLSAYLCKKISIYRILVVLIIVVSALAYAHSFALDLLNQANSVSARKQQLSFTVEEVLHQQAYQTIIARAQLAEGLPEQRIFLNWKAEDRPFLGEQWQGEVTLRPLSARLNFGGFDRQQWYFSKGVIAVGTVKEAIKIGENFSWRTIKLQRALRQTSDLSQQGLLMALAFGERAWLDDTSWKIYQQTNTAHLIAISGLHIGLAAGIGFLLLRALQFALPTLAIQPLLPILNGLLFALLYAYLAGFSVPTLRAISALVFVAFIQFSRRYYSAYQLFVLVVAFLLFYDPLMPLSTSFWLSAGAVGCLIVWYRYVPFSLFQWRHKPFSPKVQWVLGLFHLQFGLLILFTPLQLFLFNSVAANGFFANLIAVPLYSFLLVPLILFAVLTDGAFYSWSLANGLAEAITRLIAFFQGEQLTFSFHSVLILTAICSLLFLLLIRFIYRERAISLQNWQIKPSRGFTLNTIEPWSPVRRKKITASLIGIALLCLSSVLIRQCSAPHWHLDTLDVGQGLATLIVKNNRAILYDTGAAWKGGSMAELEILPYLRREGITPEKLILSHDDNDHAGGAKAIFEAYPNAVLISPSAQSYGETYRIECLQGKVWHWQGLSLTVLSPQHRIERAENADSCVILVEDGRHRVLLTGDAEIKNEQVFARSLGKIDVLQVGHHGSKTSTGEFLLAQSKPDIAVISSGRWNPWKFPHPSVMERLRRYQSRVENTAVSGQIRVNFYSEKLTVQRARHAFSPWYAREIGFSNE